MTAAGLPAWKRVLDRVLIGDGCWEWQGPLVWGGYGTVKIAGRKHAVHRVVYETLVGPIPEGLEIDHLCRNRACVNPSHLEPVTHQENVRRGSGPSAVNATKTHCPRGHGLTSDNVYVSRAGKRTCKVCHRAHQRDYARQRQEHR